MTATDDSKIVFVGSSRAHRHYDAPFVTDSLGIPAINLGEDGRGISYQYPLLAGYLNNNNPDIIVLEISPAIDGKWNERISMLYPLANNCAEIPRTASLIDPNNQYYLLSSLYRYNSNLLNEFRNYWHPFDATKSRGFDPVAVKKAPKGTFAPTTRTYLDSTDPTELQILENLIELCQSKHIKLVGVISPIYADVRRRHDIDSVFASHYVPLIDNINYRQNLAPEEYFKDQTHLNIRGAREYTKYVMRQLTDSIKVEF